MSHILLSSGAEGFLAVVYIAVIAFNIFLIVKFLEIAKDVKSILFILQGMSRDSKTTATAITNPAAELQEPSLLLDELNSRIVGAWSCVGNIVYYINADGTYEKKKYKMSNNKDLVKKVTGYSLGGNNKVKTFEDINVIEAVKGSWNIDKTIITFTKEGLNNENESDKSTFYIVDFGLTTMKFVNPLTHSEFRLNRISEGKA